ncbi:MAG TPA: family 16 glycoside hydrolase [Planctomycetota bacterium]|jgi:type 1 glutamine amidotransferase|nr:family 16 glycoside hydrolase [Planctomycetota bacterium]
MLPLLLLLGALRPPAADPPRVLFLTHSASYQHSVVTRPAPQTLSLAEAQLTAAAHDSFDVDATQDCGAVTKANLSRYEAVVFYTSGELPFDEGQKNALLEFVKRGGGFVGIHPAADTFYGWPAYGEMLGGIFDGHPWNEDVRVRVEDPDHPSTHPLGASFTIADEIYQFRNWERSRVHVLLSLDPQSVDLSAKGVNRDDRDFALSWSREFGEGRVFYTALGHREEVWQDPRYLTHLVEGIRWAMGRDVDAEGCRALLDPPHASVGWKQEGPGGFRLEDGVAIPQGATGLWWFAAKPFENILLRLEFLQEKTSAGSGVFVRLPDPGNDPWVAVKYGYSVRIGDDGREKSSTGAIGSSPAPSNARLRRPGEWNDCEIACVGNEVTVRMNGGTVDRFVGDRRREGFIGLQNRFDGDGVRFRNVRVKELPANAVAYHVLFEGAPQGWKMAGPGGFDVEGDCLVSRGGMGLFWHERPFEDFLLLLDWKVARREDNSGVFVRFPDPGTDPLVAVHRGYEVQICDGADPRHRTGSIYDFQDSTRIPTADPGSWNHMEIAATGTRYVVRINGRRVNDFTGERSLGGFVGIQNHDEGSRVSFRNIRVVELRRD